jgi:hypothetical protein
VAARSSGAFRRSLALASGLSPFDLALDRVAEECRSLHALFQYSRDALGPHRTIYLTDIDANGKVARASARRRFRELTAR